MTHQTKVEPRKMIDNRVKLGNTSGSVKRNKSGECVVLKSAQGGFTMAELLVVMLIVVVIGFGVIGTLGYIAWHFLSKFW